MTAKFENASQLVGGEQVVVAGTKLYVRRGSPNVRRLVPAGADY